MSHFFLPQIQYFNIFIDKKRRKEKKFISKYFNIYSSDHTSCLFGDIIFKIENDVKLCTIENIGINKISNAEEKEFFFFKNDSIDALNEKQNMFLCVEGEENIVNLDFQYKLQPSFGKFKNKNYICMDVNKKIYYVFPDRTDVIEEFNIKDIVKEKEEIKKIILLIFEHNFYKLKKCEIVNYSYDKRYFSRILLNSSFDEKEIEEIYLG
jgi:hypothetical protein